MPDPDITGLLHAASQGEAEAQDRLYAAVYDRLRELARRHLRDERPDHTLGATALVHEAFLKLVDSTSTPWEGQAHFYGVASQAMRRILVDHARRRTAAKRGRQHQVTLDTNTPDAGSEPGDEIVAVDEALNLLAREDPRSAKLVELRYFGGMTIEQTAKVLGISTATAKRDWRAARAWLHRTLEP